MSDGVPDDAATDRRPPRRERGQGAVGSVAGSVLGICLLLLVAAAVATVALWAGGDRPGWGSAVGRAAAACLPGSLAAWLITRRPAAEPGHALVASLAAITLRTLPPLAVLAWLTTARHPAAPSELDGPPAADAAGVLVAFYLALLATDVLLHIMVSRAGCRRGH